MYLGEHDLCAVILSLHTFTPGKLKNMPNHSWNQTYDVLNACERNDLPAELGSQSGSNM